MDLIKNTDNKYQILDVPSGLGLISLLVKNTFWLLLDRAFLAIGTAIAGILLIRSFGPSKYGMYTLAISTGSIVAGLTDLGLRLFFVRNIASNPNNLNPYFSCGLLIKALQVPLTIILTTLIVSYFSEDTTMNSALIAGVAFGIFLNIADLTASFFIGSMQPKPILLGRLVGRLGTILIIGLTIIFNFSVPTLLILLCILQVLVIILRMIQLKLVFQLEIKIPSYHDTISTIRPAMSFYIYSLTAIAYTQVGFITLGFIAGKEAVGILGAAFALVGLFPSFVYAGVDALMPVMANLCESERWEEMISLREHIFETILLFSTPVVFILAIYSNEIVIIFGKRFGNTSVSGVLSLLALHACLGPLEGLFGGAFLTAANQLKKRAIQMIVAILVLVLLSCSLGWLWDGKGTAIAMISADVVLLIGYASSK